MIAEVMTPGREGAPKTRGAALEMRGDAPKPRGAALETRGGTLGPWIGGGRGAGVAGAVGAVTRRSSLTVLHC